MMEKYVNLKKNTSTYNDAIHASQLINQYYTLSPDPNNNLHNVIFGTSGHRGSSEKCTFNEAHVLAISQSIVKTRIRHGITGPCYIGKDTHILSEPAFISVLEVLSANGIDTVIQKNNEYTPTPVISHAILRHNKYHHRFNKADGIIITSSHNPPEYGGIKYNSIFGGPASIAITQEIEKNANIFLLNNLRNVHRITLNKAWKSGYIHTQDFIHDYVKRLSTIINMDIIKKSQLKLGVNPLSGASISYWQNIAQYYQLDLTIINEKIDNTFSFMSHDYDGRIRIDCSSELIMNTIFSQLHNNRFDLIFLNDPDCDRHGIITPIGLIQSNYYFAIVINYLLQNRPLWNNYSLYVGNTCVSSSIINRIIHSLHRKLLEVPVGFKWFVKGLFNGYISIAGEDSAGATFLDFNCSPWSTDKDGLIMCLLAAEIIAVTDQPLNIYHNYLNQNFGMSSYNRIQFPINDKQQYIIKNTLFDQNYSIELAGDPIIQILNIIPPFNNQISIEGVKIITKNGWAACRLSGTESVYKIYCESFLDISHRKIIEQEILDIIYAIINQ